MHDAYLAIAEAGLYVEGVVATIEAHTVSGCRHLNNHESERFFLKRRQIRMLRI
jgi:hypothetical protein